jgi:hypothetical protein
MNSRTRKIIYTGVCAAVAIACIGDLSAFDGKTSAGKLFAPINTLLTSSITPLVLSGGAVGSVAYAAVQQSVTPLLYGASAVLFYTGAKTLVKEVAALML